MCAPILTRSHPFPRSYDFRRQYELRYRLLHQQLHRGWSCQRFWCSFAFSILVIALASSAAGADQATEPILSHPAAITHHHGLFHGKKVDYTATVEAIDVPDDKGKPSARVTSFAYTADNISDRSTRPVVFAFNGGPITASLWLHIGVMGPKRVAVPDDLTADPATYALVDNFYSPLDAADLVFVDPASTGYSRVLPGTPAQNYYSIVADGQQITAFIGTWLAKYGRTSSPVYLLGESYGTIRAAEVAAQLAELPQHILVSGVVLLGQAINIVEYRQRAQNIISYVVSLPTLAALAWYHNKVDRGGKTMEGFVQEAWEFAQTDYLKALFQGSDITPAERDRVAERLERFSGIPAAYYREHALRISKEQYRGELLKDRGLLLGRNDGRYVAPMTSKGLAADPSDVVIPAFERLFSNYVRTELKVNWPDEYVPIAKVGGLDDWKWGGASPFSEWAYGDRLFKVMKMNPHLRILIGNGYEDTQTTIGAAEYASRQSGWPEGRASLAFYEGGHMAYTVEGSAKKFTDDVRALISSTH
jgi:carboxypeptidase C (cathepsin A)